MKKFNVNGEIEFNFDITVEANNAQEAEDKAFKIILEKFKLKDSSEYHKSDEVYFSDVYTIDEKDNK